MIDERDCNRINDTWSNRKKILEDIFYLLLLNILDKEFRTNFLKHFFHSWLDFHLEKLEEAIEIRWNA